MSALKPATVKYVDNFAFDLNSQDINACRAVTSYNGVLRGLPALIAVTTFNNFAGLFGASTKQLFAYLTNGLLIYSNVKGYVPVFINANKSRTVSCFCQYRDKVYFSYEDKQSYKLYPMTCEQISESKFSAMCFVNDRLLGLVNGTTLYLGENGEDTINLEGEGNAVPYVTLPTACQAMVAAGLNDVYLLGQTCYKLTVSADFSDVKLKRIATGLTPVNKRTALVLGDKTVFATNNALYAVSKDKVTRIFPDFDRIVKRDYSECRASVLNGKYVLSASLNKTRLAYVLDVDKQQCIGVLQEGVLDIREHNNFVCCVTDNGNLNQYSQLQYADGTYVRTNVDFGTPARKFLRRINVRTKGDIRVSISDEYGEQQFFVNGSDSVQSIPVVASGVSFTYKITSVVQQMHVDRFELVAETYKEADYGN